jgi:hypothetical protein
LNKPLKDTLWTRFVGLMRGVVFYGTVYWRRASDELKPPRTTAKERKEKMPVRDFTYIKPREKPRARINRTNSESQKIIAEAQLAAPTPPPKPAPTPTPEPLVPVPFEKRPPPALRTPPPPAPSAEAQAGRTRVKKWRRLL